MDNPFEHCIFPQKIFYSEVSSVGVSDKNYLCLSGLRLARPASNLQLHYLRSRLRFLFHLLSSKLITYFASNYLLRYEKFKFLLKFATVFLCTTIKTDKLSCRIFVFFKFMMLGFSSRYGLQVI